MGAAWTSESLSGKETPWRATEPIADFVWMTNIPLGLRAAETSGFACHDTVYCDGTTIQQRWLASTREISFAFYVT